MTRPEELDARSRRLRAAFAAVLVRDNAPEQRGMVADAVAGDPEDADYKLGKSSRGFILLISSRMCSTPRTPSRPYTS